MEEPKFVQLEPQHSKAFADDLTIISSQKREHQDLLNSLCILCREIDLVFNPSKCVSYSIDGNTTSKDIAFRMGDLGVWIMNVSPPVFPSTSITDYPYYYTVEPLYNGHFGNWQRFTLFRGYFIHNDNLSGPTRVFFLLLGEYVIGGSTVYIQVNQSHLSNQKDRKDLSLMTALPNSRFV